jgi:hypothetical protein
LLMPKDDALLNFVATWLDLRTADGSVERVFDKHLRAPW